MIPLCDAIRAFITEGSEQVLAQKAPSHLVRRVSFAPVASDGEKAGLYEGSYAFEILNHIPAGAELLCIFPGYGRNGGMVDSKKVTNLAKFSKQINKMYRKAIDELRLIVAYGSHVFEVRNLVGTLYIFWTSYVNYTPPGANVARSIWKHAPVLFNLDGLCRIKSIFIFPSHDAPKEPRPLVRSPIMTLPVGENLFVCETRKDAEQPKAALPESMEFITEQQSRELVSKSVEFSQDELGGRPNNYEKYATQDAEEEGVSLQIL